MTQKAIVAKFIEDENKTHRYLFKVPEQLESQLGGAKEAVVLDRNGKPALVKIVNVIDVNKKGGVKWKNGRQFKINAEIVAICQQ